MRKIFVTALIGVFFLFFALSYAAQENTERKLVLRQAQAREFTAVGVEAYLTGNILEATVYAKRIGKKPRILNIILFGPELGRLSPSLKETTNPKAEEKLDISFPRTNRSDTIRFYKKAHDGIDSGDPVREFNKFNVPAEKILPDGIYEFRILLDNMENPGATEYFSFPIKGFDKLFIIQK